MGQQKPAETIFIIFSRLLLTKFVPVMSLLPRHDIIHESSTQKVPTINVVAIKRKNFAKFRKRNSEPAQPTETAPRICVIEAI